MTESEEQKNVGEKLTLEDAVSLVNGYANLCEIWVREARRGDSLWDRDKDHAVIYLEKLGDMVGELWELWHRTTHQYPILRPVIRSMGASVLDSLQWAVVMDDTLDDDIDMGWDVQCVICMTRHSMEARMDDPPWRMCDRDSSLRCRHSNDYKEESSDWECYHCEDRGYHADEAKELETQTKNPSEPTEEVSDTEEEHSDVSSETEQETEISTNSCLYDLNIHCVFAPRSPNVSDHERELLEKKVCEYCVYRNGQTQTAGDPSEVEDSEAEPADEGSDTEEENPEVPADQTEEGHLKYSDYTCLYDDNVYCSAAPRAPDIRDIERVKKELCSVCRAGKCPKLDDVICPNGGYSAGRCGDCELRPRTPAEEYFRMEAERMKRMEAEWTRSSCGVTQE